MRVIAIILSPFVSAPKRLRVRERGDSVTPHQDTRERWWLTRSGREPHNVAAMSVKRTFEIGSELIRPIVARRWWRRLGASSSSDNPLTLPPTQTKYSFRMGWWSLIKKIYHSLDSLPFPTPFFLHHLILKRKAKWVFVTKFLMTKLLMTN